MSQVENLGQFTMKLLLLLLDFIVLKCWRVGFLLFFIKDATIIVKVFFFEGIHKIISIS